MAGATFGRVLNSLGSNQGVIRDFFQPAQVQKTVRLLWMPSAYRYGYPRAANMIGVNGATQAVSGQLLGYDQLVYSGIYTLSGRVVKSDGSPLAGMMVVVYPMNQRVGAAIQAVTTPADGSYRFDRMAYGLYRVEAFDPVAGRYGAAVYTFVIAY